MKEKKITARKKQAIETKKKIYTCGIDLIQKNGYENVTVKDISKKSKVSIGTFYHYFNSKFDLLVELFNQGDEFFKENSPIILESDKSCLDKIVDYFELYSELSIQDGVEKVCNLYVTTNNMFLTHGRLIQDILTSFIQKNQYENIISDEVEAELITEQLFVVARGVIFDWCLHKGKTDLKANMSNIIKRIIRSYII